MKNQIENIDKKIKEYKNKKKKYFLQNSTYIFNYFEEKKNISTGTSNMKILDKFFNICDNSNTTVTKSNQNIQKYFGNIDSSRLDINNFIHDSNICRTCNNGELIPVDHEGILVCNNCSSNVRFLIENEKPTYKEPPKEVCFYAYKRINHFREDFGTISS